MRQLAPAAVAQATVVAHLATRPKEAGPGFPAGGYPNRRPRQRELVTESVRAAFERTFFYAPLFRKHFRGQQITVDSVCGRFFGLPFTSKEDVVRNYPDGFLAVPPEARIAYFESSGT